MRGLCGQKQYLKHASISAVMTLSLRPLVAAEFSSRLLSLFVLDVLSIPGLVLHLQKIAPEVLCSNLIQHFVLAVFYKNKHKNLTVPHRRSDS